jgi:hypothetical protein
LDYPCTMSLTEATDAFGAGHRFTAEARSGDFRYSGKFRFIELVSLQGFRFLSFRRWWEFLLHPNFAVHPANPGLTVTYFIKVKSNFCNSG